jgi:hypothetical protein
MTIRSLINPHTNHQTQMCMEINVYASQRTIIEKPIPLKQTTFDEQTTLHQHGGM